MYSYTDKDYKNNQYTPKATSAALRFRSAPFELKCTLTPWSCTHECSKE